MQAASQTLGGNLQHRLAAAWKWSAVDSRILARVSLKRGRLASSLAAANARTAALQFKGNVSNLTARSATTAPTPADAPAAPAPAASSSAQCQPNHANGFAGAAPQIADPSHRALIIRQSTALICFEPKQSYRPNLPAS